MPSSCRNADDTGRDEENSAHLDTIDNLDTTTRVEFHDISGVNPSFFINSLLSIFLV